jgi:TonB family protein
MKRLSSIVLILTIFSTLGFGQQPTIVLTNNSGDELPVPYAKQRRIYVPVDSVPGHWHCRIYSLANGALEKEYLCRSMQPDTIDGFFKSYSNKLIEREAIYVNGNQHGTETEYYGNGNVKYKGYYNRDQRQGLWKWYYPSGALMADLKYTNDELVSGLYYNENGEPSSRAINDDAGMPQFPGGQIELLEFMGTAIYPEQLRREAIGGVVLVSFTVDTFGKVKSPTILYSPDTLFSKSALEVVNKMPLWEPGYLHMQLVNVNYLVPFHFKIVDGTYLDNLERANYFYKIGGKATKDGDMETAYKMFSKAAFLNSEDMHFLLNKAITALNLGKVEEACMCIQFLSAPESFSQVDVEPYLKYCE